MNRIRWTVFVVALCTLAGPGTGTAQDPLPASSVAAPAGPQLSQDFLDSLLAPIALYPDQLLSQVLMASTYPLEIVSADRWVKANPNLKDKALEDALQQQTWDPSVKSLAVFPQVLAMMSDKLDWTQKLGDAFLAQQQDVMATAQALRAKAQAEGHLKDSKEQKVTADTSGGTTIIQIEPTNPEVVYVPTYDPTIVYGAWPYPAYPPYYWYPPGYVYAPGLRFAAGVAVGWALWGNCNWRGGDVNINVNRYNNFNRTNISNGNWNHNAGHRGAVPYRDQRVAQQYGRGQAADAASREAFRGRADAGRESFHRGDVSPRDVGGARDAAPSRDFGSADRTGTRNASAFDTRGGAQTRDYSSRGNASMSSARSAGNMGGGARAGGGYGGGGARGGGGGGGRGGGRR
jgi:hypothetical protein